MHFTVNQNHLEAILHSHDGLVVFGPRSQQIPSAQEQLLEGLAPSQGEALAPPVALGCGGAQPRSPPHVARPKAQRTEILHEEAKSPPSQERALGAAEPAVRNGNTDACQQITAGDGAEGSGSGRWAHGVS